MAHFDRKELKHLEHLCRIDCSQEEEDEILASLTRVLEYIDQLNLVETEETPPCTFVLSQIAKNEWRKDELGVLMTRDQFLANAPDQIAGMIRIPPILGNAQE